MISRLTAIEQREQQATKGPWLHRPDHADHIYGSDGRYIGSAYSANGHADGEFIAHARTDIPYLLSRTRQLREALETLISELAATVDKSRFSRENCSSCVDSNMPCADCCASAVWETAIYLRLRAARAALERDK